MIEAILRDLNFWGQRPGLLDLPPVPVVELTGEEFGAGLGHMELMQSANDLLRALQRDSKLVNADTGWKLRINKIGRKKMGDNADQSDAELKAVAGIEQLARVAIVSERLPDDRHRNPYVVAVIRMHAPLLMDGVLYRVRLTVKDYGDPKLLHALSSIEIENALGRYSPASDYSVQPEPKSTERTVSIRDLFQTAT